jgi:hypothetical protein
LGGWADSHKPAAAVSTHLLLAAGMWLVVGSALIVFGSRWLWAADSVIAPWIATAAVAVGVLKSLLVLDGVARKTVDRIRARGDGRCIGGFLSLQSWALVLLMMAGGRILRSSIAAGIVGPIYIAVGSSLCLSSRLTWRVWLDARIDHNRQA